MSVDIYFGYIGPNKNAWLSYKKNVSKVEVHFNYIENFAMFVNERYWKKLNTKSFKTLSFEVLGNIDNNNYSLSFCLNCKIQCLLKII